MFLCSRLMNVFQNLFLSLWNSFMEITFMCITVSQYHWLNFKCYYIKENAIFVPIIYSSFNISICVSIKLFSNNCEILQDALWSAYNGFLSPQLWSENVLYFKNHKKFFINGLHFSCNSLRSSPRLLFISRIFAIYFV